MLIPFFFFPFLRFHYIAFHCIVDFVLKYRLYPRGKYGFSAVESRSIKSETTLLTSIQPKLSEPPNHVWKKPLPVRSFTRDKGCTGYRVAHSLEHTCTRAQMSRYNDTKRNPPFLAKFTPLPSREKKKKKHVRHPRQPLDYRFSLAPVLGPRGSHARVAVLFSETQRWWRSKKIMKKEKRG